MNVVENSYNLGLTMHFNDIFIKPQSVLESQSKKAPNCLLSKTKPLYFNVNKIVIV